MTMAKTARLLVLTLLAASPIGLAQINIIAVRVEGLVVRYTNIPPTLLNSETGLDGATVIRGGEGATGIAAWANTPAGATRGGGATNIGF